MVHVKKCPLGKRGNATTEFYHNGKPQKYCYGWIDKMNDEPLDECKKCLDFVDGEQCEIDFQNHLLSERRNERAESEDKE